jgi:hypothetical protein
LLIVLRILIGEVLLRGGIDVLQGMFQPSIGIYMGFINPIFIGVLFALNIALLIRRIGKVNIAKYQPDRSDHSSISV